MDKVIEKIKAAKSVAVIPHINEDPDALGSCFAFCEALKSMGKEAICYLSKKPQHRFDFIGGEYTVYDGSIKDHDLCACLDCGDVKRLGDRKEIFDKIPVSVNIDHHITNDKFATANYVDAKAAATGEILVELFGELGVNLNDTIARFLYIAISADTGSFKFSSVTPKTMMLCAKLLEYDFDHANISRLLFDCDSLDITKFRAKLMGSIESYHNGLITAVEVKNEMLLEFNIDAEEIPNIVDIPRKVDGCEIALAFKVRDDGINVNFRSNNYVDVSKIAAKFGGGGHIRAAGCTISGMDMDEVKKRVIEECVEAVK